MSENKQKNCEEEEEEEELLELLELLLLLLLLLLLGWGQGRRALRLTVCRHVNQVKLLE